MRHLDIALTAIAPLVWGSTYFVTTEFLPSGYPVTMAALRALPAGLLLLVLAPRLPPELSCFSHVEPTRRQRCERLCCARVSRAFWIDCSCRFRSS